MWEQHSHIGGLIAVLEEYKDKKEAVDLTNELKKIHEEINLVKDSKDMNEAKFKSISQKIFALRTSFTG